MNNAIILLSGGLDSVVSLASIKKKVSNVFALMFNYGQKSFEAERKSVDLISKFYSVEYKIVDLEWLSSISKSSLTSNVNVPRINSFDLDNIETTKKASDSVWIPNRNSLFINIAACFAEAYNYNSIVIGANKEESVTFKDNSMEFINAINLSLKNSVNSSVEVLAPLISMSKSEIVEYGIILDVPFHLIHSCYLNGDKHCGFCESCQRLKRALKLNNRYDIIDKLF